MLHGTIEVDRLMRWMRKQQRDLEWIALKEYWRADVAGKQEVLALYGEDLVRGLQRYKQRYLLY